MHASHCTHSQRHSSFKDRSHFSFGFFSFEHFSMTWYAFISTKMSMNNMSDHLGERETGRNRKSNGNKNGTDTEQCKYCTLINARKNEKVNIRT